MRTEKCSGAISQIVAHPRGAVITRRVELPDGLSGEVECIVDGMADHFREDTARVQLGEGQAQLVAVRSHLIHPEPDAEESTSVRRWRDIQSTIEKLEYRREFLVKRRKEWDTLRVSPGRLQELREQGPASRVKSALTVLELADVERQRMGKQIQDLDDELDELRRELQRIDWEDQQISDEERRGQVATRRQVVVHLDEIDGLSHFDLSYVVDHVRWWPTYSVYLDSETQQARLELEAMVVQQSGADWNAVQLSLSTSDLDRDAELPRLASLRLGRSTPAPPSGYRPAPKGTDDLFAGYDQDQARLRGPVALAQAPKPPASPTQPPVSMGSAGPPDGVAFGAQSEVAAQSSPMPPMERSEGAPRSRSRAQIAPTGGPPPAPPASPAPMDGSAAKRSASQAPPEALEPTDGWLNFDQLRIAPPESSRRGQLVRLVDGPQSPSPSGPLSGAGLPDGLVDPAKSRGHFDYRYDGQGLFEIPSDGRLHRIRLRTEHEKARWKWRCVPRVEPAVYREVHLQNPLSAALLDGEARIFIDEQFAAVSTLERVDQGGEIRLGLGVEERIQVRRNTRYTEEAKGFLKGRRALDHSVEISLRSGLGHSITVEVADRLPVTDDDEVQVDLLDEAPASREFDQSQEGRPIRGGRKWIVELGPGATETIEFSYRLQIRSKDEIIGGNRRES